MLNKGPQHVEDNFLKVYVVANNRKGEVPEAAVLCEYDIVITTHTMMSMEASGGRLGTYSCYEALLGVIFYMWALMVNDTFDIVLGSF